MGRSLRAGGIFAGAIDATDGEWQGGLGAAPPARPVLSKGPLRADRIGRLGARDNHLTEGLAILTLALLRNQQLPARRPDRSLS